MESSPVEFQEFEKISRLNREVIVTEKIDGTNGQVHIRPADGSTLEHGYDCQIDIGGVPHYIRAGSRNGWVAHVGGDDNNGFGRWVYQHAHELAALGAGAHFGEWWGQGIQRKYGLTEKRWSLFNVGRWVQYPGTGDAPREKQAYAPPCCHVVPVLRIGVGLHDTVDAALEMLREYGSKASPGFMKPEGIVAFHTHARTLFKVTLERDQEPKSMRAAS
jgi:RNA ligase